MFEPIFFRLLNKITNLHVIPWIDRNHLTQQNFTKKLSLNFLFFVSTKYFSNERNFSKTLINTKRILTPNSFVLIDKKKSRWKWNFLLKTKFARKFGTRLINEENNYMFTGIYNMIRWLLRFKKNATYVLAKAWKIDGTIIISFLV